MVTKILMVCLGNICRSPLAEGILKSKVDPQNVFVDSGGTGNYHIGNPPDERSIAIALKHGIDIAGQRCRQFTKADFQRFDIIYAMDRSIHASIIALASDAKETSKVHLLLDAIASEIKEVPDPYHDGEEGFEKVFQMINSACEVIATKYNPISKSMR